MKHVKKKAKKKETLGRLQRIVNRDERLSSNNSSRMAVAFTVTVTLAYGCEIGYKGSKAPMHKARCIGECQAAEAEARTRSSIRDRWDHGSLD